MPTHPAAATFNTLSRPTSASPSHPPTNTSPLPSATHSSSPNHWHISLQTLSLSPPGDLLFLIQPSTAYIHVEGPTAAPLLTLPSAAAQAAAIAPLLLKAFNAGLSGYDKSGGRFAPMSWVTGDRALGEALGRELKRLGVRKECRIVGVAGEDEERRVGEEWGRFRRGLESVTRG